jgi:CHAT domain-containing protein/tetratricopeptide (TPR) repeat protein
MTNAKKNSSDLLDRLSDIQGALRKLTDLPEDRHRRVPLYAEAVAVAEELGNATLAARLSHRLGQSLTEDAFGERTENIERAIDAFLMALRLHDGDQSSRERADILVDLSLAFYWRMRGLKAKNLEQALSVGLVALEFYSSGDWPQQFANLKANLGNIYSDRINGDPVENSERAISSFEEALETQDSHMPTIRSAAIKGQLGYLYLNRVSGDLAGNLERALTYCEDALQVFTRDVMSNAWAAAQTALGNILVERVRGDRASNVERAIECYREAITIHTRESCPAEWAMLNNNLGRVFTERPTGSTADNIELAISFCSAALEVHAKETLPYAWGMTQHNLGNAYCERIRGERADNLEAAIAYYNSALEVRVRESFPLDWALTKTNLGKAYIDRIKGDRSQNIEVAIASYSAVLEICNRQSHPRRWASLQDSLGNAYLKRIHGERADNIRRAITHHKAALEVFTREALPYQFAMTANNLGNAYSDSAGGNSPRDLECAISCYESAIEVLTFTTHPVMWAAISNNLGSAYHSRVQGETASNLEKAISCYEAALRARTRETMPLEWAATQCNLGAIYWDSRLGGDRTLALGKAIDCFRSGVEVYDGSGLWARCRNAAKALGDLGVEAQSWDDATYGYQVALQAAQALYEASLTRRSREAEISITGDLHLRAAHAFACSGRLHDAVTTLEQGRARGLEEALMSRHANLAELAELHPHAYNSYCRAADRVRDAEESEWRAVSFLRGGADDADPTSIQAFEWSAELIQDSVKDMEEDLRKIVADGIVNMRRMGGARRFIESALHDEGQAARSELKHAIARLREIDGFEEMFDTPTFDDVARAVESGIPVAYIAYTNIGSLVLLASRTRSTSIHAADQRGIVVEAVVVETVKTADGDNDIPDFVRIAGSYVAGQEASPSELDAALGRLLPVLGKRLIEPLAVRLSESGAKGVVIVACGFLGLLPLHAGVFTRNGDRSCLLDQLDVSFAPSARVVSTLRSILPGRQAKVPRFAAVGDPHTELSSLKFAEAEVIGAASYFQQAEVYCGTDATKQTFLNAASRATHVHLACHGKFDSSEPRHSYLALAVDGDASIDVPRIGRAGLPESFLPDTLIDYARSASIDPLCAAELMSDRPFRDARLVIASACQTAVIDVDRLPDEVVSFSAALLQAGAVGAIGTLWKVNDLSTALLMEQFYQYHLRGIPEHGKRPMEPVRALRLAQYWLARVTAGELAELFLARQIKGLQHGGAALPDELVDSWIIRFRKFDVRVQPFASPFFWAPFVYVGA